MMFRNNKAYCFKLATVALFSVILLVLNKTTNNIPNLSPLIAIITIGVYFFRNKLVYLTTILISQIISDLILGIYGGISIVYLSLMLIAFTVDRVFKKISFYNLILISIYSSFVFYLTTNPIHLFFSNSNLDFNSLMNVYRDGLPFFANTLYATLAFNFFFLTLITIFRVKSNSAKSIN